MNILQMHYFLKAAELLNLSKAADQLFISQPALSKQISTLEKELGFKLFQRGANSVRLTPSGAVLLKRLPALLQEYYAILSDATRAQSGHIGTLTIGNLEGQRLSDRSAEVFRCFGTQHPQYGIKLVYDSFQGLRQRLDSGELDIALSLDFDMRQSGETQVAYLEACKARMILSRSFEICQKDSITFSDLKGIPFILPEDSYLGSRMIRDEFHKNGLDPEIQYAANLYTVMLLAEAGMGVAIVNDLSTIVDSPRMRVLYDIPLESDTVVCCAWKKNNPNPAVALFLPMLLEQAGDAAGDGS